MTSTKQGDQTSRNAEGQEAHDRPGTPGQQQEETGQEQDNSREGQEQDGPPRNRMAEAIERGGILGWGSYLTFAWAGPFLKLGSTVTLKEEHLEGIYKTHESRYLYDKLRLNWERERGRVGESGDHNRGRTKGMTFLRALMATFKWRLGLAGLLMVGSSIAHIMQALTLGWLIGYFENEKAKGWEGWTYACCIVLCAVMFSFMHHHYCLVGWTLGMQLRTAITTVLYDKILRLRLSSLGQITTGHLVNLTTTDVEKFQYGGTFSNYLWQAPLESLVILYFGLDLVGVSFLAGFAALALMVPTQAFFSRKFTQVRQRVTVLTDERVKLTNQAVTGARIMKINAWEPALENEIRRVRAEEVRVLLKATLLRAINEAMFFVQPAVLSCLVFVTYHALGNVLKPREVFTTLALLNITQLTMGKFFYMAVQSTSETWVSIKRMETILLMEESEARTAQPREFHTSAALRGGVVPPCCKPVAIATVSTPRPPPFSHGGLTADSATRGLTETESKRLAAAGVEAAAAPAATTVVRGGQKGSVEAGHAQGVDRKDGGGQGEGGIRHSGCTLPGLVFLNGVSFRWAIGREKDEHAKIFRELMKVEEKKRKVTRKMDVIAEGSPVATNEDLGGAARGGLTLDAIDLRIEPGQLVGVVGSVGSSKSSLLMAILGEIAPARATAQATVAKGADSRTESADGGLTEDEDEPGVLVKGTLAYASQEPWIQSGTLRENILFGRRMDRKRYDAVLGECALERDLSLLPSGDQTGIGDRGVNLSGGQKARAGLARMAYSHADTYLMDDPLSAVDPAVGRELFSNVVCGRLKGSTRILVTHQVHYLNNPAVDQIVVMHHGKIVAKGRYAELEASGSFGVLELPPSQEGQGTHGDKKSAGSSGTPAAAAASAVPLSVDVETDGSPALSKEAIMVRMEAGDACEEPRREEDTKGGGERRSEGGEGGSSSAEGDDAVGAIAAETTERISGGTVATARGISSMHLSGEDLQRSQSQSRAASRAMFPEATGGSMKAAEKPTEGGGKEAPPELVVTEDQESGGLKRSTYWDYTREAAGVWQVVLIFLSMAGGQVLTMGVTVWLARWSRQTEEEQGKERYVVVLALLAAAAVVVSLFRAIITFFSLVKASHRLHDRMLKRIVRAPVLFFDSNPVGRILNRFTKDIYYMDDLLPMTMYDFIVCSFMVTGGTLIVFIVNPWVVLSMLPAVWYFMYLMGFYMKTSREAKRLEAVTRSPVYSQLSETLDGLVTVRAFRSQNMFLKQFTERVDMNTRAYFAWVFAARWLGFRMNIIVIVFLMASCFFSVAVNEYSDSIDAGLLGAALVYVLQLSDLFQWAVRQSAEVENQMVSAERVLGYCRVPQEASLESAPAYKPAVYWPTTGGIEVRDMSMRYREDLPPVLRGLTLTITGGSRVGVVGRTGAGKSSLISALFRLVECDKDKGGIEIDGVNIANLGLHDLRPRMSVVPQTPFLFSGSIRLNLDPFTKQSDTGMWDALEAVQMKGYVQALPDGLDALVTEGGGNLSVGQRQLLCLARAVLQRSRILVMDEATANIDERTDALIQDVVRTSFKGKTVIMVAHRLNTVIDCDQVVVLSEGRVVEAGHPHLLLQAAAGTANSSMPSTSRPTSTAAREASSSLSSMVEDTGQPSAGRLRRLARDAWFSSQRQEKLGTSEL